MADLPLKPTKVKFWNSSPAVPFNPYPLVPRLMISPQPAKIKDKEEKGHSRSTKLVPYAIPLNPLHSSPLTFRNSLNKLSLDTYASKKVV